MRISQWIINTIHQKKSQKHEIQLLKEKASSYEHNHSKVAHNIKTRSNVYMSVTSGSKTDIHNKFPISSSFLEEEAPPSKYYHHASYRC